MSQYMMEEDLDVPLLPRLEQYRDPNEVLPLDTKSLLQLTPNHFVSGRTVVLGKTGAGKGNVGSALTEFLLEAGLPLTFVDLEGEGYSLKEICPSLLVVGRSAHADREYGPEQMGRLAELSVQQKFSVVLDFSGYSDEEIFERLLPYLESLWITCDRLRTPYHLLLDEVHELVPEEGTTPVKSLLRRIAKRGRKRGLGLIAMSQETASVDKKFLRQTDIRILLSVSYEADLKIYHSLIPGISLESLKETLPAFPAGKGYVVFKHQPFLVHFPRRRTFDPSETPKLGSWQAAPILQTMDTQMLDLIDQALPSSESIVLERLDRRSLIHMVREQEKGVRLQELSVKEVEVDESLKKQLEEAALQIQDQERIIEDLRRQVALLSMLPVEMPETDMQIRQAHIHMVEVSLPPTSIPVIEASTLINSSPLPSLEQLIQQLLSEMEQSHYKAFQKTLEHLVRERSRSQLAYDILKRLTYIEGGEIARSDLLLGLQISQRVVSESKVESLLVQKNLLEVERRSHTFYYKSLLPERLKALFPGKSSGEYEQLVKGLFLMP